MLYKFLKCVYEQLKASTLTLRFAFAILSYKTPSLNKYLEIVSSQREVSLLFM